MDGGAWGLDNAVACSYYVGIDTLYNIQHSFNFTPCKRELVNGYFTTFWANSSNLQFYGIGVEPHAQCLAIENWMIV